MANQNLFITSNAAYETWIKKKIPTVQKDFQLKHERMTESPFFFFRAVFFRWSELWINSKSGFLQAPAVLSVGDLHLENFGTWRDSEGRLCWGVNDFDEAYPLPYLFDIVRLASSVLVACEFEHLSIKPKLAFESIISGYVKGLQKGGQPFVLEEDNSWLRETAVERLRKAPKFWKKISTIDKRIM